MAVLSQPRVRGLQLRVHPDNEGPMALMAKRPVLESRTADVSIKPGESGSFSLRVAVNADAFFVTSEDIGAGDRRKIEALVRDELLEARRYPRLTFEGELVDFAPEQARCRVRGQLELHGRSRPLELALVRGREGAWTARCELRQSDFGIKPTTAFLGALRSKDAFELEVEVEIQVPS